MSLTSWGRVCPAASFTSRMRWAVICARVVSEQYAAAKSNSFSLFAALSASAMPDSVNGELDQPCNLLYRLKNVCPCRTR